MLYGNPIKPKRKTTFRRTDIDNNVLVNRYKNGESVYRIAKDLGLTDMTVRKRLKMLKVYEGKNHNKNTEE